MSTKPDDTTLALWLDDELDGEALATVEAWAKDHPEQLAARDEIRRWREMISASVPASEEPPAPELFNGRIARAIREDGVGSGSNRSQERARWRTMFMPLAACAGMVLAFWLGMKNPSELPATTQQAPAADPELIAPMVYTPETGVKAEWFSSTAASATVIVLDGVDAIPDSLDFAATASRQQWNEIDSTADLETQPDFD